MRKAINGLTIDELPNVNVALPILAAIVDDTNQAMLSCAKLWIGDTIALYIGSFENPLCQYR